MELAEIMETEGAEGEGRKELEVEEVVGCEHYKRRCQLVVRPLVYLAK
jgi:AAA+ superfamily predicted ATPase